MHQPLDIFKREPGGRFVWLATASNLIEANSKIRSVSDSQAEFLIVNEDTGERTVIRPSDPDHPRKHNAA